jgi:bifunctional non-homologous end joining protein LigD
MDRSGAEKKGTKKNHAPDEANGAIEEFEGTVSFTNLDKVLYPATGFTKGDVIRYYVAIASFMLPHLKGRPLTLRRYPNGVDDKSFFEKRCPSHAPDWVRRVSWKPSSKDEPILACDAQDTRTLAWLGNMAAIELHPSLAFAKSPDRPTVMVFDLDPGAPAAVTECAKVAIWLREKLDGMDLQSFPKTSGSKGLQIYVPLNSTVDFDTTKTFSHALALMLESEHPELVVSRMSTQLRKGKVFIDWSQNDRAKTTVAVYSLRARERPTVSTPLMWEEVVSVAGGGDPGSLVIEAPDAVARTERHGDLFEPVASLRQHVPVAVKRALADLVERDK